MEDLARKVRWLEDRALLSDLILRYFIASDGDDLATVGASFAEHATFLSSGAVSATGRDGIVEFIRVSRATMGLTVHTLDGALFTFRDDDHASGFVNAHLELVLDGRFLFGAVRYEDEYVREPDSWRITRRDMKTIYIAPWAELGRAMESAAPVRWSRDNFAPSDLPRP